MTGLSHVTRVVIPKDLFEHGHSMLRAIGDDEVEGLVLWAGSCNGEEFHVKAVLQPAQRSARGEHGLLVLVDGHELHRVGVWLYEQEMQLIAQVHSHPTDAYHSETDDAIPIVTTEGGLSLVVPDFARGVANLQDYACYRLEGTGAWRELSNAAASALVHIIAPPSALVVK